MSEITRPLSCSAIECGYFGNLSLEKCPLCGEPLIIFDDSTTKLLNRINTLSRMRRTISSSIIIGRQKKMVIDACEMTMNIDPEIIPQDSLNL